MKINELKVGQTNVNLEIEVDSVEEPRKISKYGRNLWVANAMVHDDSGSIAFTIWNNQIEKVKKGMKLKIENGYINEFNGRLQLTLGKFGIMRIIG